jgi:hypothetical protein
MNLLKPKYQHQLAGFLFMVFALILFPKELVHELYGHHDTHCHPGLKTSLEPRHTHCKILQLEAFLFTTPHLSGLKSYLFTITKVRVFPSTAVQKSIIHYNQLRGPPIS